MCNGAATYGYYLLTNLQYPYSMYLLKYEVDPCPDKSKFDF